MARSRRQAREAALKALYKLELAKAPIATVLEEMRENSDLPADLQAFAERIVAGTRENQGRIDRALSAIIQEYELDRVAVVDRNVLRIAAFELLFEPAIAPAITINEAIEISRKYSTLESGKFVNGVLGAMLPGTDKANWDPETAPVEEREEIVHEQEPVEVTEEDIAADSDELKKLSRIGGWKLRTEEPTE